MTTLYTPGNDNRPGRDDGSGDGSKRVSKKLWPGGRKPNLKTRRRVQEFSKPSMMVPLAQGLAVHLGTASLVLWASLWQTGWFLLAAAVIAIGYRGLENLVHGGAHYYLSRNRRLNDLLSDLMFAWAVLQSTAAFRANHLLLHHGAFGTDDEPCFVRMSGHPDVRAGRLPTFWQTLLRVPAETLAFYRTVGSQPAMLLKALAWQAFAVFGPVALLVGPEAAAVGYGLTVPIALMAILPVIRCFAETAEHDYADGEAESVVERTFDHRGVVNGLLHPFGDEHHLGHHAWPGVPQWRLRRLHAWAIVHEALYHDHARYRSSVLGSPQPYVPWRMKTTELTNDNDPAASTSNDNWSGGEREEQ